ncbi:unannotated protein [freshwater metagenome]|uniref:Unannotated protein n=1 Tax=freshwater metagenome TaxID=449393 RepID=A0A6J7G7V6_9ZZZZ
MAVQGPPQLGAQGHRAGEVHDEPQPRAVVGGRRDAGDAPDAPEGGDEARGVLRGADGVQRDVDLAAGQPGGPEVGQAGTSAPGARPSVAHRAPEGAGRRGSGVRTGGRTARTS